MGHLASRRLIRTRKLKLGSGDAARRTGFARVRVVRKQPRSRCQHWSSDCFLANEPGAAVDWKPTPPLAFRLNPEPIMTAWPCFSLCEW
jgi:hypothetical protein